MNRCLLLLIAVCALAGCSTEQHTPQDPPDTTAAATPSTPTDSHLCIPGERVGAITDTTSERALMELYGRENVLRDSIDEGEGLLTGGTTVFPRTADEVHILWMDPAQRNRPRRAIIDQPQTAWHTPVGITIGTTLDELVRYNGRHFTISGFGWDYGGTVLSWEGGELADSHTPGSKCIIRLSHDSTVSADLLRAVSGDTPFSSADQAIQALGLRVSQLSILFEDNIRTPAEAQ